MGVRSTFHKKIIVCHFKLVVMLPLKVVCILGRDQTMPESGRFWEKKKMMKKKKQTVIKKVNVVPTVIPLELHRDNSERTMGTRLPK